MKTITTSTWAILCLTASAQNLPTYGVNKPGFGDSTEALAISERDGRTPNATTGAVAFDRTYNNAPESWFWRVNITDFAVPNRPSDLGSSSANFTESLHVANTQWELSWPGNATSLQSYLGERELTLSINTLITSKPTNVTSKYLDSDRGNCTAILGSQCVQSLAQAATKGTIKSYQGLAGCEGTLNVKNDQNVEDAGIGIDITSTAANSTSGSTLNRGDTFFFRTSSTYQAGNTTVYNQSTSALQLLILNFASSAAERGEMSGPTVLCKIVEGEEGLKHTSAAPQRSSVMKLVLAMVTVVVMAVSL